MLTVTTVFKHYIAEHCRDEECNVYATRIIAKMFMTFYGHDRSIATITKEEQYRYVDARLAQGRAAATVRKHFTIFFAAIRYAISEGRLDKFAFIKLPKTSAPRIVWLEDAQVAKVFEQDMSERMRRFYRIAFASSSRARAIEELQVGRVDFDRNEMDFRVPGVRYKNKRRGPVPIAAELLPDLKKWCEGRAPDEYVIGVGESGRCTGTYHLAVRVMKAAGLYKKGFPPRHVCRKTWASQAAQAGVPSKRMEGVMWDKAATIDAGPAAGGREPDQRHQLARAQARSDISPAPVRAPRVQEDVSVVEGAAAAPQPQSAGAAAQRHPGMERVEPSSPSPA